MSLSCFLTFLQMRLPLFFPLLIAVLSCSLQHHCHGSQHWSRRYSPGRTGDYGHSVDISGAAYWRHYADHRCGLVSVSPLLSSNAVVCAPCQCLRSSSVLPMSLLQAVSVTCIIKLKTHLYPWDLCTEAPSAHAGVFTMYFSDPRHQRSLADQPGHQAECP